MKPKLALVNRRESSSRANKFSSTDQCLLPFGILLNITLDGYVTIARLILDVFRGSVTKVRGAVGEYSIFGVEFGLHQGSSLSPYLFIILVDVFTENVRNDGPDSVKFIDEIAACVDKSR